MGNAFHVIHGLPSFPRGRGGSQEGHGLRIGRPERASPEARLSLYWRPHRTRLAWCHSLASHDPRFVAPGVSVGSSPPAARAGVAAHTVIAATMTATRHPDADASCAFRRDSQQRSRTMCCENLKNRPRRSRPQSFCKRWRSTCWSDRLWRSRYASRRPPCGSETDRRAREIRPSAQASNAETPAAMSVSTTRIATCDAARRLRDRGRLFSRAMRVTL